MTSTTTTEVDPNSVAADVDGLQEGANGAGTETAPEVKTEAEAETETEIATSDVPDHGAPNSKPRKTDLDEATYVYRDFSTILAPPQPSLNPQSLQAQKLPAKLASMLSDQGEFSPNTALQWNRAPDITHSYPYP